MSSTDILDIEYKVTPFFSSLHRREGSELCLGRVSAGAHVLHANSAYDLHWSHCHTGRVALCGHQVSPWQPLLIRMIDQLDFAYLLPTNPCLTGASIVNNTAAMWLLLLLPFLCSKLFPSLIHRHPNGSCANFLLAHSREAIIFPFIISPILCLPTYFVFKVRETLEISTREHEAMYHVYFDTNSMLFR